MPIDLPLGHDYRPLVLTSDLCLVRSGACSVHMQLLEYLSTVLTRTLGVEYKVNYERVKSRSLKNLALGLDPQILIEGILTKSLGCSNTSTGTSALLVCSSSKLLRILSNFWEILTPRNYHSEASDPGHTL